MPNQINGILILNDDNDIDNVETLHATSLHQRQQQPMAKSSSKDKFMSIISPKPNSISTIIRSYKSAVKKHVHRLGYDFAWQTWFYDHIIRNRKSYQNISNYIINNPLKWEKHIVK